MRIDACAPCSDAYYFIHREEHRRTLVAVHCLTLIVWLWVECWMLICVNVYVQTHRVLGLHFAIQPLVNVNVQKNHKPWPTVLQPRSSWSMNASVTVRLLKTAPFHKHTYSTSVLVAVLQIAQHLLVNLTQRPVHVSVQVKLATCALHLEKSTSSHASVSVPTHHLVLIHKSL